MSSFIWKGQRWRVIWNRLHFRKTSETFHDFLIALAYDTLGQEWIDRQRAQSPGSRHAIVRWFDTLRDLPKTARTRGDGGYLLSGPAQAALSFAYDLYFLQLVNKLPDSLVERLRDSVAFQGARYEICIAAIFAHADFEITLLDESVKRDKHCEFIAKHKRTGTEVYVEAKSRKRRGVLHEAGLFDETKDIKGDVVGLYQRALTQAPPSNPFFIFIDANLPTAGQPLTDINPTDGLPLDDLPWMVEIEKRLKDDWAIEGLGPSKDTAVIVTNYAPYFGPDDQPPPPGLFAIFPAPHPANPMVDPYVMDDLFFCLRSYGSVPKQI
jgi:hypothetical protein